MIEKEEEDKPKDEEAKEEEMIVDDAVDTKEKIDVEEHLKEILESENRN